MASGAEIGRLSLHKVESGTAIASSVVMRHPSFWYGFFGPTSVALVAGPLPVADESPEAAASHVAW